MSGTSTGLVGGLRGRETLSRGPAGQSDGRLGEDPSGRLRRALARVPSVAWICAAIAFLNGAAWSLITPPFQGRDEPDHFAYVQELVENQTLPGGESVYSSAEGHTLIALHQSAVRFSPQNRSLSTAAEQRALERVIASGHSPVGPGQAGLAASEPPLYYAIEALPYELGRGNVLAQLELMRLVSALMGALSALLIVLFLREAFPRVLWAGAAAGVCVAMFPLFGFMSGTLNPDVMLFAVASAAFLCLARAFRRGLTPRRAAAIGLVLAVGLLTKINFVGLVPGIALGVLVLTLRQVRARGSGEVRLLAIAAGLGSAPVVVYALANLASSAPTLGVVSSTAPAAARSISNEWSYVWQLYLPRLPGMPAYFRGLDPLRELWFNWLVGLYGWLDTMFPAWVYTAALVPAGAIGALCARELVVRRSGLRARLPELVVYGAMALGVLALVGSISYLGAVVNGSEAYVDPRYLLPMLAMFAGVLTLAIRGAGRRWGPPVAVALVALFLAHDLLSQLQTIARYYG